MPCRRRPRVPSRLLRLGLHPCARWSCDAALARRTTPLRAGCWAPRAARHRAFKPRCCCAGQPSTSWMRHLAWHSEWIGNETTADMNGRAMPTGSGGAYANEKEGKGSRRGRSKREAFSFYILLQRVPGRSAWCGAQPVPGPAHARWIAGPSSSSVYCFCTTSRTPQARAARCSSSDT